MELTKGKIGILVIALGRYTEFWPELYTSCEKYFLPNYKKEYYIFTDAKKIKFERKNNVHSIYQKKLGWPFDTMMRFEMFASQKDLLKECDYLYFLNINLVCRKTVGEEIIPKEEHDFLMVCSHPGYYNKPVQAYPYDRNPNCTAYIPMGKGNHYAPGGFNGGRSAEFLKFCEISAQNVRIDLKNKIIAQWHDESHLNKYILDKKPLIMPINYMYPKSVKWLSKDNPYAQDIKMELRDKVHYGGHYYLRGTIDIKNTWFNKIKYKFLATHTKNDADQERYLKILQMLHFGA